MSGIVIELQKEILTTPCDILNVLRKAHVIANKLQLKEFDSWIISELNGYNDYDSIPEYRRISGTVKAWNPYHGWILVVLTEKETEDVLCNRKLKEPIGELIEIENKSQGTFIYNYTAEANTLLNETCDYPGPTQYALHVSSHLLRSIIEIVKTTVLEWTIKLEAEGIIGEEMQFSSSEKEVAKSIPQTVNNYYGNTNVINSAVEKSAIVAGNVDKVEFSYEKARDAVSEIEEAIKDEDLSEDEHSTAMEMLSDIKEKVSEKKKGSIIKAGLVGLKDYLIGVAASATVAVIQAKIQGLF